MKKSLLLFSIVFLFASQVPAQFTRYVIRLKDKGATTFSLATPADYLSTRAIARRTHYSIALDSTDLPVPASYISQIQQIPNVTVLNTSRWLNTISIQTNDANALNAINALPFVSNSTAVAGRAYNRSRSKEEIETFPLDANREEGTLGDFFSYGNASFNEIHLHNGEFLHNIGLRGQGMDITIIDGGFANYTGLHAFDSVNLNGQVKTTWDFVAGNASVVEDNSHGMMCFSTIAANIPGQFVGKAPKASFNLFRTEDVASEYPIEEFNWVCGAERADSTGSDIISSSVGYGYLFNAPVADYPYSNFNGDTNMSAIGADLAAKKGLLIFVAAGNSGNDYWHYIVTPADADSVIAVGSVNSAGAVASSSSYGPSADGRVKPDMASVGAGAVVQTTSNTVGTSNGTSFACPNMAGLGTCLWQGFPEFNNMRIVRALKEAGNSYATPDNRTGYGIPDLKVAFTSLLVEFATSSSSVNNCTATISWTSKDVEAMKYEIERKAPGEASFTRVSSVTSAGGISLAKHSYQVTDDLTGVGAGIVSYRIRQVIDTSAAALTAAYIDTTTISFAGCTPTAIVDPADAATRISISPNPGSNPILSIETTYAVSRMPIAIYDMKGQLILEWQSSKQPGKLLLPLPAQKLPGGRYIVKVFNGVKQVGTASLLKL
jgi:serine protease AprX